MEKKRGRPPKELPRFPDVTQMRDVKEAREPLNNPKAELLAQAEQVRETVRKQSYDGRFFCDNAVRQEDGTLKRIHYIPDAVIPIYW